MAGQTNHVVDTILQKIDDGVYLPGSVLDEQSLADELSVSRTPVREAFIRLEATGLIQRGGRRGAKIFKPATDDFLKILEVHAQLECQATELAARRINQDQREQLIANIQQSEKHLTQFGDSKNADYYQLNMQFHQIILDAANNTYLGGLIKTNARLLMSYYRNRYRFAGVTAASVAEHKTIADLIITGNPEEASTAMLKHFDYGLDTIMDLLATAD